MDNPVNVPLLVAVILVPRIKLFPKLPTDGKLGLSFPALQLEPLLQVVMLEGQAPITGAVLTVMFAPLSLPVTTGVEETTRILYPAPATVPPGRVELMEPLVVLDNVPMLTGVAKLPVASLNCAVKILPELKVPTAVYGTLTVAPAHTVEEIVPVVIELDTPQVMFIQ